jgi:membrane peptidoglycan carboxypeptidase
MLTEVTRVGTGTEAQIKGYSVAGKTGTANKPKEGGGGYQEGAYVATFAGFVPAEAPRLSAIVVLDEPTHGYYGGKVAAPTFAEVVRYALRLLRVPPPALAPVVAVPPLVDPSTKDLDVVPPPPSTTVPPTTVPPASVPTQTTVPTPTTVPAARPTTLAAFPSPPVRP